MIEFGSDRVLHLAIEHIERISALRSYKHSEEAIQTNMIKVMESVMSLLASLSQYQENRVSVYQNKEDLSSIRANLRSMEERANQQVELPPHLQKILDEREEIISSFPDFDVDDEIFTEAYVKYEKYREKSVIHGKGPVFPPFEPMHNSFKPKDMPKLAQKKPVSKKKVADVLAISDFLQLHGGESKSTSKGLKLELSGDFDIPNGKIPTTPTGAEDEGDEKFHTEELKQTAGLTEESEDIDEEFAQLVNFSKSTANKESKPKPKSNLRSSGQSQNLRSSGQAQKASVQPKANGASATSDFDLLGILDSAPLAAPAKPKPKTAAPQTAADDILDMAFVVASSAPAPARRQDTKGPARRVPPPPKNYYPDNRSGYGYY
eukprot:TRINITY_DN2765_c0_g1_i1.p1 TRINITY_DN2765_c0_g1~~TRINITY_DN2765_c0_g1_i1.p1  ORF type:complete len:377 (+),score=88.74 TRINITY_DN2765_c0_g1_i1:105-1235(+)